MQRGMIELRFIRAAEALSMASETRGGLSITEAVASLLAAFDTLLSELEADPGQRPYVRADGVRKLRIRAEDTDLAETPELQPIRYEELAWTFRTELPDPDLSHQARWTPVLGTPEVPVFPNVAAMPDRDSLFDYLAQREQATPSAVHRARYADLLWSLQGGYRWALAAAQAYLDSVPWLARPGMSERVDAIARALQLALALRNQPLIDAAKRALLQELDCSASEGYPPLTMRLLCWLLSLPKRLVSEAELQAGRRYAEMAADAYRTAGSDRLFQARVAYARLAEFARRLKDPAAEHQADLALGEVIEEQASLRAGDSRLVQSMFLHEAFQHYMSKGITDRLDDLKRRIERANEAGLSEMGALGTPVRLDFTELDTLADELAKLAPAESLARFIQLWDRAPDKRSVAVAAEGAQKEFPLSHIFPRAIFNGPRRIATAYTDEEKRTTELFLHYGIHVDLAAVYLARLYRRMADLGRWTADAIVDFLASGVVFDEDKLPLLRTGIERYFARDYISALHVLVPQVEDTLRRLIGKMGLPTTGIRDGVMQAITLGDVLKTDLLRQGLGEDFVFYLQFLFTEQQGKNLRNEVAHGLLPETTAREPLTTLVVDALLTLRAVELRPTVEAAAQGEGIDGSHLAPVLDIQTVAPPAAGSPTAEATIAQGTEIPAAVLIREMTDRIVHEFRPLRVILFGSYARGQQAVDSDVDLLVVLPAVTDRREAAAQIRKALVDIPIGKDVLVTDPEDIAERGDLPSSVLYSALREGRVLYDRE